MEWHSVNNGNIPVGRGLLVTVEHDGEKAVLSNMMYDGKRWTIKVPFIIYSRWFVKSEYITHWMDMPFPADSIICDDLAASSDREENESIEDKWEKSKDKIDDWRNRHERHQQTRISQFTKAKDDGRTV